MAERATLHQVVQLGVETTPGTAVAANRKLLATTIEPSIQADFKTFRPVGGKWPTVVALGKEWSEAKISAQANYTDVVYLLSSCLAYAAPVQQGATTAYKWTHTPGQSAEDAIKTYTVEWGSSVRAAKFAYGLVTEFGMTFDRDNVEFSGSMMGQAITDGIALTGSPTEIELKPILPAHLDVYLDTTSGGLGTTKLTRVLKGEFNISNRFGPLWAVNSAVSGFAAHVETEPACMLKLTVEADATGMGLLANARAGDKRFLRVKATSTELAGTGFPYSLTLDLCGEINEIGEFSDEDGVYAIEYTFNAIYDSAWAKAFTVDVINKLTTL